MDESIIMQYPKRFEHVLGYVLDFPSGQPLSFRCSGDIVVKILEYDGRRLQGFYYLVEQRTESRRFPLEAFEDIALILKAPMSFDTLDHDAFSLLIAFNFDTSQQRRGYRWTQAGHTLRNKQTRRVVW